MMNRKVTAVLLTILVFSASVLAGCVIDRIGGGNESAKETPEETPTERRTRTETPTEQTTEADPSTSDPDAPVPVPTGKTNEGESLWEVRYSSGGNMNGNTHSVELSYGDDGTPVIIALNSPAYWIPVIVTEVDPGADAFDRMEALLAESGMDRWKDVDAYYVVMDGPSTSLSYEYRVDGAFRSSRSVRLSFYGNYTDEDWEKVRAAREMLTTLTAQGTVKSVYMWDEQGDRIPEGPDAGLSEKTIRYMLSGDWMPEDVVENGVSAGSADDVPEKWQRLWLSDGRLEVVVNEYEDLTIRRKSPDVFPVQTSWSAATKDGQAEMTIAAGKLYLFDHDTGRVYVYGRNN